MDYIDGQNLNSLYDKTPEEAAELFLKTVNAWNMVLLSTGFIHADLHFGNILNCNGRPALIDFGSSAFIPEPLRELYLRNEWESIPELKSTDEKDIRAFLHIHACRLCTDHQTFLSAEQQADIISKAWDQLKIEPSDSHTAIQEKAIQEKAIQEKAIKILQDQAYQYNGARLSPTLILMERNLAYILGGLEKIHSNMTHPKKLNTLENQILSDKALEMLRQAKLNKAV